MSDPAATPASPVSPAPRGGAEGARGFSPPTADQLAEHLAAHPFHPPSPWAARGPLVLLLIVVIGSLMFDSILALVLPWLALGGLLAHSYIRNQRARDLERRVNAAHEQAMLRQHRRALRLAWGLVPDVAAQPLLRGRTLGMLGQCLSELCAHDAAIVAFDAMLENVPEQHPAGIHLRLQRAIEALGADRLADADDALRKLRGAAAEFAGTPLAALHGFAELLQEVRTVHVHEAVQRADSLVESLRPLGVEAGYGYGLLAWCYRNLPEPDEPAAALWWDRATRLLPGHALGYRYRELTALTDDPPAAVASAASAPAHVGAGPVAPPAASPPRGGAG